MKKITEKDRREVSEILGEEYTAYGRTSFIEERFNMDYRDIASIRDRLDEIEAKYGAKYDRIYVDTGYGYDNDEYHVFKGRRMETDEELQTRLDELQKREAERLDKEREEFERLKAKFGD